MKMDELSLKRIKNSIIEDLTSKLNKYGFLFRVFGRVKSIKSMNKKIAGKEDKENYKLQDLIGIRITTYFSDDIDIVRKILIKESNYIDFSVGEERGDKIFGPDKINLIFNFSQEHWREITESSRDFKNIDRTYEIQLRTVLSEGWHEVEHDLRYKCKSDWESHQDLSRTLNGIFATLETSDWSMVSLFDKLSYLNYKEKNWSAMIRNKFRIRIDDDKISEMVLVVLNQESNFLAKNIYKINRESFLDKMIKHDINVPLKYDNIIYLVIYFFVDNYSEIINIPSEFIEIIETR